MQNTEENKIIARRWLELVSERRVEELCEMTDADWKMHGGPPGLLRGPQGVRELFRAIGRIEQRWTIEDTIAEDDKVVVRAVNQCEQESFCGLKGDGIRQRFSATFIFRIRAGRVLETWRNADDLGRVVQLGGRITAARA